MTGQVVPGEVGNVSEITKTENHNLLSDKLVCDNSAPTDTVEREIIDKVVGDLKKEIPIPLDKDGKPRIDRNGKPMMYAVRSKKWVYPSR